MSRTPDSRGVLTIDDLRSNAERRAEERIARQRPIETLPCTSKAKWDFKSVLLSDCSLHGLAILSDEPMQRGQEFLAKLMVKRMTMVVYRVAHCEQLDQFQYRIGA